MAKKTIRRKKKVDWKKRADNMWSLCIRMAHNQCEICGKRGFITKAGYAVGGLNAHHLISRGNLLWRHDLRNGLCLCTRCHMYSPNCSPHSRSITGVLAFCDWMQDSKPEQWAWYDGNKAERHTPELTYEELYYKLKDNLNTGERVTYDR